MGGQSQGLARIGFKMQHTTKQLEHSKDSVYRFLFCKKLEKRHAWKPDCLLNFQEPTNDFLFGSDTQWGRMTELNPYTKAMCHCLEMLDQPFELAAENCATVHFLTNMVQGRMLDHLVHRVGKHYQIEDPSFEKELTTILIEVFSDELFARFRQKIDSNPALVFQIAQRIQEVESNRQFQETPCEKRSNRLYLTILRQYLEYNHIDEVIETLNSNANIQKLIGTALMKKYLIWLTLKMASPSFASAAA